MVSTMADKPIILALSNPDPEILPELAHMTRDDLLMGTGRSDYPNQVNNVLGFPYIFKGALDVRASCINMEMKIAAVHALAELAREPVPQEVLDAYGVDTMMFGSEYLHFQAIRPAPAEHHSACRIKSSHCQRCRQKVPQRKSLDQRSLTSTVG